MWKLNEITYAKLLPKQKFSNESPTFSSLFTGNWILMYLNYNSLRRKLAINVYYFKYQFAFISTPPSIAGWTWHSLHEMVTWGRNSYLVLETWPESFGIASHSPATIILLKVQTIKLPSKYLSFDCISEALAPHQRRF